MNLDEYHAHRLVIDVTGDMTDGEHTGVSTEITATGKRYTITGPLALAINHAMSEDLAKTKAELKLAYDQLEAALEDAANWKQAASDWQDLIATPIDIIEERAREEGRREGIEAAMKKVQSNA